MKITKLDKPLSYWLDDKDPKIVYVLYRSFTSWDKTMLGKINIQEEFLDVFRGDNGDDRSFISSFINDACGSASANYRQLDNGYNDSQIKIHVREIVESISRANLQNTDVKQLLLHVVSDNYQYSYTDVKLVSIKYIVEVIEQNMLMYFKYGDLKKSCYCGITNDIDIRMEQHRTSDFSIVDERVCAYVCANVEVAKQVEGLLGEHGYDIGGQSAAGNGAVDSSCIVYFLKKWKLV